MQPIPLRFLAGMPLWMHLGQIRVLRLPRKMLLGPFRVLRLPGEMLLGPFRVLRLAREMLLGPIRVLRLPGEMPLGQIRVLRLPRRTPGRCPIQGVTTMLPEQYDTAHDSGDHILLSCQARLEQLIPNFEIYEADMHVAN